MMGEKDRGWRVNEVLGTLGRLWEALGRPVEELHKRPFLLTLSAGMAILLLATIIFKLPRAIASLNWPTAKGVVISSEVYEGCCGEYSEGWWPRVSYHYSVNGRTYVSDRIEVEDVGSGNNSYFAERTVQRYPQGEHVQVYYDPRNPAIAVLEPGIPDNAGTLWPTLIAAVTAAGGILVAAGLLGIVWRVSVRPRESGS